MIGTTLLELVNFRSASTREGNRPFFARVGEEVPDVSPGSDAAAFLMPWLLLLLVAMLTGAASPGGVDPLYPVRIAAAIAVQIGRRAAYRGLAVAPVPRLP